MQLTTYTDYALRTLLYLGAMPEQKLSKIKDISTVYNISNHHLSKIVYELGQMGLIETVRGRSGGIKLGQHPKDINIGWVVRKTEENVNVAECFDKENNACVITPACKLKHVLYNALEAFFNVLDGYTLHDLLENGPTLYELFLQKHQEV